MRAWVNVEIQGSRAGAWSGGFVFPSFDHPLIADEVYPLDLDPNSFYGYWSKKVVEGLASGGVNTVYKRVADPAQAQVRWPQAAVDGQSQFFAGLDAFHHAGTLDTFEASKRAYIRDHGDSPTLLVRGHPSTGKSYSTAFALFARLQGSLVAGAPFRGFVSCKTHTATDVLLENIVNVQNKLRSLQASHPDIFARYIDARLVDIPLFRVQPREVLPEGVRALNKAKLRGPDEGKTWDEIVQEPRCSVAVTPGGTYRLVKERWDKPLFGQHLCDCLVLEGVVLLLPGCR